MVTELEKLTKAQLLEKFSELELQNKNSHSRTNVDLLNKLMHELQVHQIELEMQNRELREAQLQLEVTRDNYADLYDFAPVNYFTFNKDGIITNINLTGAAMLGEVRSKIIDKPFIRWIYKNDLATFITHLHSTLESDTKNTVEIQLCNKNNHAIDVRIDSVRNKDLSTDSYFCRSVIFDVTDSNKKLNKISLQARQLELITDALPVLIAYIDRNETHLFANKTYTDTFGYDHEDISGKKAADIWGEKVYKNVSHHLKIALAGQPVIFETELPIGDSGKKYFHTSLIPDIAVDNHTHGVIVLVGDITDRLAIEAIDRKHLLDIAHFSRLSTMGEMASEIAHELNQPLAAISIYSDACIRMLLSGKKQQDKIIQSLNDINIQAIRAGDFIRHIRDFASKKDMQRQSISINDLVESALHLLKVELRTHQVQLILNLDSVMKEVIVDKILIEQVIFNLARNALEAMDEVNETERILRISTCQNKNSEIEVSIEDSGPGISETNIKKIFESFYSTKDSGMGMGLTISRSIIEAHHGKLWATENSHGGTTFSFTLPLKL